MKAHVLIEANGRHDEMGQSIIRFGKVARNDKDTELHLYEVPEGCDPVRIERQFVSGAKSLKFDLTHGKQYIVVVIGDKVAGVATTAPATLQAPFNVFMNPPEDHSKDFLRLDIPTDVPIIGDLRKSILSSLKEK